MNSAIPPTCSFVQTLLKSANDKNKVVAFLAVDVIDIVNAPNSFVIKAEQLLPKNPVLANKKIAKILPLTLHVVSSPLSISP
mmetsp:Transcript_19685/g.29814  ORF Transcript_19685/g.29814 Transcript_19685/m.29814 type:complete len:82 (-) Transcript_19685:1096-1341(-)